MRVSFKINEKTQYYSNITEKNSLQYFKYP